MEAHDPLHFFATRNRSYPNKHCRTGKCFISGKYEVSEIQGKGMAVSPAITEEMVT
jgi:hypothetical protein